MKLIAALCMLCLAVQAQQSESPKIAFAFNGGPCLADGDPINSYCAIVVTGAVALASAPVVVEWCGGLDGKWSAMATNHLTAGSGKFWLRTNVDLAWTIFYDYDWRKTPAKFYRIKTIKP